MQSLVIQRIATTAVMPLVAASGWAGYSYYTPAPQQVCTILTTDLYYNSYGPGSDIQSLQRFLSSRGYLSASPTGYFGPATRMGVSRFQADQGIPVSGYVDGPTRQTIQQITCTNTATTYPYQNYQPPYDYRSNGQLSIQGIDAPQSLSAGTSGSWTVRVIGFDYRSGGTLHYSVVWGDENDGARRAHSDYGASSVQSSGTFTHVYMRPGTYTPVFTVTDDYGRQVSASATTRVYGTSSYYDPYSYSYNSASIYPCTGYYDRSCYVNGRYIGPSFDTSSTYNGPGDTCYYANGQWQGNCGYNSSPSSYQSDYSCYYDRACLAQLTGRPY